MILGIDNAGKTTFLERVKNIYSGSSMNPKKIQPTVGLNIGQIKVGKSEIVFWDLGGGSRIRDIWSRYYHDAHGIVFVVDGSDPSRLQEASQILKQMLQEDVLKNLPLLILVNKKDKSDCLSIDSVNKYLQIEHITNHEVYLTSISSATGDGMEDAINWLISVLPFNSE
eukprot:CAMPEP_0114996728 /NCGR_PEP_ID=MMETSP0216-20121206/14488_1 /TAXON_ID=223996 /ORGANISM="Protocruzia adherens, Strain Boccale" /LENGTH=168 /DNA_ID=CAMNT_0002360997 /DNA_START=216 /DNA_END=722 /DNA_ORIENTATION=-